MILSPLGRFNLAHDSPERVHRSAARVHGAARRGAVRPGLACWAVQPDACDGPRGVRDEWLQQRDHRAIGRGSAFLSARTTSRTRAPAFVGRWRGPGIDHEIGLSGIGRVQRVQPRRRADRRRISIAWWTRNQVAGVRCRARCDDRRPESLRPSTRSATRFTPKRRGARAWLVRRSRRRSSRLLRYDFGCDRIGQSIARSRRA